MTFDETVSNETPPPTFLESVEKELASRYAEHFVFGVAIDGSQMSDRAVAVASGFYTHKRGDFLKIFHVSDNSKGYLKKHLQPTHLRNYYVDLAACNRASNIEWVCREKEESRSTCECVTRMADKHAVDALVVGSFGRKGEKLDVLGTVSDFSLRTSHSSVVIVRSTGPVWDRRRGCRFLFATDGSHASAVAFVVLIKYFYKPNDSITVLKVTNTITPEEQLSMKQFSDYMSTHGIPAYFGRTMLREISVNALTVPEVILDAIHDLSIDVVVLGVSGYGKKKLGSVSEEISVRASCTSIVIKDSREVNNSRYRTAGVSTLAAEINGFKGAAKSGSEATSLGNGDGKGK